MSWRSGPDDRRAHFVREEPPASWKTIGGGKLVAFGTPEEVAESGTHTGEYLKKALRAGKRKREK